MIPFCAFVLLPLQKPVLPPCCHAPGSRYIYMVSTCVRTHTQCATLQLPWSPSGALKAQGPLLFLAVPTPPLPCSHGCNQAPARPSRYRVEAEDVISFTQIKAMDHSE